MSDGTETSSNSPVQIRRAVCVGVGTFAADDVGEDEEPELDRWDRLPYAESCTRELHQALQAAGYAASIATDPTKLSASQLGRRIDDLLGDVNTDVAVVHVLSHGEHRQRGGVYVVGANGAWSPQTRVEDWVVRVSDDPTRPYTLFLLDLCHAGAATRLQWQPPGAGEQERAWVIAAAGAADPAFAGRLTRAAAAVVRRIVSDDIDFSPTLPVVPFDILFDLISREVRFLTVQEGGHEQQPTATPSIGSAHVPFFPNPRYHSVPARSAAEAVDAAAAPFVDPVLDAEHFRDRATGHGPATDYLTTGCFSGRAPQLERLSAWMDGIEATNASLMVVTGSPGAGKSALLGVLVCAAHPDLRVPTQPLWRHTAARPSLNPHLAAVHARQRAMREILASLVKQLHLDLSNTGEFTPFAVISAIAHRRSRPIIVVDAVDEAANPRQLLEKLLEPLASKLRPDGKTACKLLLGMRPWPELALLLNAARQTEGLLDLDDIPLSQRRHDVTEYVASLLELQPNYADVQHSHGRAAFADAVAASLVPATEQVPKQGTRDERWGEFLVAALYTHSVTSQTRTPLIDPQHASELGSAVPRTLPAVLELDLATRHDTPWMRPVLHSVAHSFGAGMPLTIVQAIASIFADTPMNQPTRQEVSAALSAARFYLRTGTDTNGTTLYRLFHQGLTNALRSRAMHPSRSISGAPRVNFVFDRLFASVPKSTNRPRWDLAEPFILRHILQYANEEQINKLIIDPEFLVHADPTALNTALDQVRDEEAMLTAAVYAVSSMRHERATFQERRQILAVDSARHGTSHLLNTVTHPPGQLPMMWQPIWATGSQISGAFGTTLTGHKSYINAVTCINLDGRPIAITTSDDATVRIWDLTDRRQVGEPLTGHKGSVNAVACTELNGHQIAVTGGDDGVRVWDLVRQQPFAS